MAYVHSATRPPGVQTRARTYTSLLRLADPDHTRKRRKETIYEFENGRNKRVFTNDPRISGIYSPED